jgi:regulator of protease activity HflC (stomatin/prohibitin superfamily)
VTLVFVVSLIFFLIAVAGLVTFFLSRSEGARGGGMIALLAGLVLGVVCVVIASVSTVPTRNVGIVTEFNKPTGRTTGAGLKWHAPWQSIDDWDASGQTYAHLGDGCVWVTIAAQRRACIPVQIEWSARAERAPENWAAYKEVDDLSRFETFVARRVNPQINAAMTSVFATFDPLKAVNAATGDAPAPDLNATYKKPLTEALGAALGEDIAVRSVAFEAPRYDEPTTNAINAYGQKVLEARNLTIDEANAKTRARISNIDASVDQVARCLQIAEKLGKEPGLCMGGGAVVTRPVG